MDLNKTANISLVALQTLATNVVYTSSAEDISSKLGGAIHIRIGRTVATALTVGVRWRLEVSFKTSGDDAWLVVAQGQTGIAATNSGKDITSDASAGATSVTMTSSTGLAGRDYIFIYDAGTVANSEFNRIKTISGSTVNIEDALTSAHTAANGDVFNRAESWYVPLDFLSAVRVRVVFDAIGVGQTTAIEAKLVTGDSIS
jgi:hypothetical protein